jgi:hypothetical protein
MSKVRKVTPRLARGDPRGYTGYIAVAQGALTLERVPAVLRTHGKVRAETEMLEGTLAVP